MGKRIELCGGERQARPELIGPQRGTGIVTHLEPDQSTIHGGLAHGASHFELRQVGERSKPGALVYHVVNADGHDPQPYHDISNQWLRDMVLWA